MIVVPSSASQLLGSGPTLRVLGPTATPNSSTIPAFMSLTVPTSAQVNDYLVVATSNSTTLLESSTSDYLRWRSLYGPTGVGSPFNEFVTIHIKLCEASDIGARLDIKAGDFQFNAQMHVFTNPNNTDVSDMFGYSSFFWFFFNDFRSSHTVSTGNTSSVSVPANLNGQLYGPNCLKFTALAANPSSSFANISYSGPGQSRRVGDSYWFRGLTSVYEVNSTNALPAGTFSFSSGAFNAVSFYLI
jgi:hypothetical protein